MNLTKNEGVIDRGIRLVLAEIFFILAFFWFGGITQIMLYVFAVAMGLTAIFGFCGAYKLLGINTCAQKEKTASRVTLGIFAFVLIAILAGGGYASDFFTKKFFLEDYTAMNQYYKQALFFTGQENREQALVNYSGLVSAYEEFGTKYQNYHPYVLSRDSEFNSDLKKIEAMIDVPKDKILNGDLKSAHLDLEMIRPIFQDILKRNGFSMLAVHLVDFHDAMEKIIAAADGKSPELVIAAYPEVSEKLRAVEDVANDPEIQMIRQNLEQLVALANAGDPNALSAQASQLKSSFVKVYLKKG